MGGLSVRLTEIFMVRGTTGGLNVMSVNILLPRKDRGVKCHDRHPESIMVAEERWVG